MLPPKGPIKPLQPLAEPIIEQPTNKQLKQKKTTGADSEAVQFPSYDLVSPSPAAVVSDDIYSVPPTGSLQHAASREDLSEGVTEVREER